MKSRWRWKIRSTMLANCYPRTIGRPPQSLSSPRRKRDVLRDKIKYRPTHASSGNSSQPSPNVFSPE